MLHAAKVDRSVRLQRIIAVLKAADHPLSAEELAVRAYDFASSRKIMLNVSTAIGEIRAAANRTAGYDVSFSTSWKVVLSGHETGMRVNKDESVTFFIERALFPWHDGRPRYWLIAAPGWMPSWKIKADGALDLYNRTGGDTTATRTAAEKDGPNALSRTCKNPKCRKPLPPEGDPLDWCCNDDCRQQWRESLFPQQTQDGLQRRLF